MKKDIVKLAIPLCMFFAGLIIGIFISVHPCSKGIKLGVSDFFAKYELVCDRGEVILIDKEM